MSVDIPKLDPKTVTALTEAGWTPARRTSPWRWLGVLRGEGYSDFAAARDVLAELGGLTLRAGRSIGPNFPHAEIIFDPILGGSGERERTRVVADAAGCEVFPLGEQRNDMLALIAEDGSIFAIGPHGLWRVASTVEGFLNLVVRVDKPVEILNGPWPSQL